MFKYVCDTLPHAPKHRADPATTLFQSAVCKAPKLAIVDQQNRSRFSSLPISPESLPWYMRGLPLAGYTRLTATYDNREHSSLVDADMKDASSEHLLKLLGKPLGTSQENISVTAQ